MISSFAKSRWFRTVVSTVSITAFCAVTLSGQAATTKTSKAKAGSTTSQRSTSTSSAANGRTSVARNPYLGAIAIEAASGKVLFESQPDAKGYPASVLKLMDLLIILEKVQRGQLSLQDQVPASANASKTGGTQVWLKENESFTVEDMLFALMIRSANDCAVALAEKIAGSTDAFVTLMNQRAHELGMNNTLFHTVHGLPPGRGQGNINDVTTARDLSILCRELVLKHPEALRYTSTRERPFRPDGKKVLMQTHNPLLKTLPGCDGLKTGYTGPAGFSIAVTAARNGQRVIVVVLGSTDRLVRDKKAAEIVNNAFITLGNTASAAPTTQPTPPARTAKAK